MYKIILPLAAVCIFASACSDSTTNSGNAAPSPTPLSAADQVAKAESRFQDSNLDDSDRSEARKVASEFITSKLPSWKVKGLSTLVSQDNIVWVAVDIEKDRKGRVLNLAVRRFFPQSGEPYWKAVLADKSLRAQLHDLADADVWRQLNEATDELDTLKNPPDNDDREPNDPRE